MAGTSEGFAKRRQTLIAKYGSEEAYLEFMHSLSAKGGRNGGRGGFAANRDLARRAGRIGGRVSRRGTDRIRRPRHTDGQG